jgi:hypothetical protein
MLENKRAFFPWAEGLFQEAECLAGGAGRPSPNRPANSGRPVAEGSAFFSLLLVQKLKMGGCASPSGRKLQGKANTIRVLQEN